VTAGGVDGWDSEARTPDRGLSGNDNPNQTSKYAPSHELRQKGSTPLNWIAEVRW
jgi:hypothetical protein